MVWTMTKINKNASNKFRGSHHARISTIQEQRCLVGFSIQKLVRQCNTPRCKIQNKREEKQLVINRFYVFVCHSATWLILIHNSGSQCYCTKWKLERNWGGESGNSSKHILAFFSSFSPFRFLSSLSSFHCFCTAKMDHPITVIMGEDLLSIENT